MRRVKTAIIFILLFTALITGSIYGQDSSVESILENAESGDGALPDFGLGMGIGTEVIGGTTWQTLSFTPDLALGDFGIGLDVIVHYSLDASPGSTEPFKVLLDGQWVADANATVNEWAEMYLGKIKYVRYGVKGMPLYVKVGSMNDGLLGNGYTLGYYSNALFYPERKIIGLSFDFDAALFGLPFFGFETFLGNIAAMDVMGGRLFVRPLAATGIPVLNGLQVGASYIMDRDPSYHLTTAQKDLNGDGFADTFSPVTVIGADFKLPVIASPIITLFGYGDVALQGAHQGGMVGIGGALLSLLPFSLQLRFMGDDFIPGYFGPNYDLDRKTNYLIYTNSGTPKMNAALGWLGRMGTTLMEGKLSLNITLDAPFGTPDLNDQNNKLNYMHINGRMVLEEGVVPYLSAEAFYDKWLVPGGDFDLRKNALIGAKVHFQYGVAKVSVVYDLNYLDDVPAGENPWEVSSKIETSLDLF